MDLAAKKLVRVHTCTLRGDNRASKDPCDVRGRRFGEVSSLYGTVGLLVTFNLSPRGIVFGRFLVRGWLGGGERLATLPTNCLPCSFCFPLHEWRKGTRSLALVSNLVTRLTPHFVCGCVFLTFYFSCLRCWHILSGPFCLVEVVKRVEGVCGLKSHFPATTFRNKNHSSLNFRSLGSELFAHF